MSSDPSNSSTTESSSDSRPSSSSSSSDNEAPSEPWSFLPRMAEDTNNPHVKPAVETEELKEASIALQECIFNKYNYTVAGVMVGTGYALHKKLPGTKGVGTMLVAGAAGTFMDCYYAWTEACVEEKERYYQLAGYTNNKQPTAAASVESNTTRSNNDTSNSQNQ